MSYSEQDGQVVLTMSREDYETTLDLIADSIHAKRNFWTGQGKPEILALLNRLNEGNPHYTPYQVEEKKS